MPAPQYAREIPQRYRLEAGRCKGCGQLSFPPRLVCPDCSGTAFETVALPDDGRIVTWTVIHVAPDSFAMQVPYVVGIVEFEGGIRITTQIADCTPDEVQMGACVHRVFRRLGAEGHDGILRYGYKFVLVRG